MIKTDIRAEAPTVEGMGAREARVNYCMRDITARMPVLVGNLCQPEAFPDISPKAAPEISATPLPPGHTSRIDIAIFIGACEVALGWFLIVAMISFAAGGIAALAGISTVLLGLVAKFGVSSLRRLWSNSGRLTRGG